MSQRKYDTKVWEWHRVDKIEYKMALYIYVIAAIILTLTAIREGLTLISILILIVVIMIIYSIPLFIRINRQRRNMWLKRVPFENIMTINIIENLLIQQGIHFRKLSLMGPIKSSPLKYVEIFELYNGALLIRLQKQTQRGTIIELGPIKNSNEAQIEQIKNIVDSGFRPQIL